MSETSATCPYVLDRGRHVTITNDPNDPRGSYVSMELYDLDAFIDEITKVRDKVRARGIKTAWSSDADGRGNCGPVASDATAQ